MAIVFKHNIWRAYHYMKKSNKRNLHVVLTRITENWLEAGYETTPWGLSLGLHYIRAWCLADPEIAERFEITVKTFHLHQSTKSIADILAAMQPDVMGFSCYVTGYSRTIQVASEIKRRLPGTHVIFGGPQAFDAEAEMHRHAFLDTVIPHEGEAPFRDLLLCRIHDVPLDTVKGIAFRNGDEVFLTGGRKTHFDISALPELFTQSFVRTLNGSIIYESSRGCKYGCGYCSYADQKYREFPMGRVKREIGLILGRKEIKQIIFADLDIANNPERFNEILDFVKSERRNIQLSGFWSSTEKILECAKKMKEAGFIRGFTVSLQSGDKNVLKKCGRSWLTLKQIEKITPEILRSFPESRVQLILGLPGETFDTFKKTHFDLYKLGYKIFHVADFMVTPGSRFYQQRAALGLEYRDPETYVLKQSPNLSEEDLATCRNFSINFQVLALLFPREYIGLYERWGIDLLELASAMPPMTKYCAAASESGSVYNFITEDAIAETTESIKRIYGFNKKKFYTINEFLHLQYNIFRFERLQTERGSAETSHLHVPFINDYLEIDVSRETCKTLGLKIPPSSGGEGLVKIFVLYNRKNMKAAPTTALDENIYARLLETARNTTSLRELLNVFDADSRKKTLRLLVRLADEGFTTLDSAKDIALRLR